MPDNDTRGFPPESGSAGPGDSLTSGRLLFKNVLWGLLGPTLPLLAALLATPVLISALGHERFGILGIAWVVIGYFAFLDLGVGRALTLFVAQRIGDRSSRDTGSVVSTSLLLLLVLGLLAGIVLYVSSSFLAERVLTIEPDLHTEAINAFRMFAVGIPLVLLCNGLRGILEAYQRFGVITMIRMGTGTFMFAGPVALLPFTRNLSAIVAVLVLGRMIEWSLYVVFCRPLVKEWRNDWRPDLSILGPLLHTGGWMTVSNVISPLMVTMDRFFIGAVSSMSAVTYYITPYEVVTRVSHVPVAVTSVLFPAFSTTAGQARRRTAELFGLGLKYMIPILFPILLVIMAFGREGLDLWVGADFALQSTRVLQWLCLGVFINSLARIPYTLVQGIGRPDLTGRLHLVELPLYAIALSLLVKHYGIEGAAIAWTGRILLDTVAMFGLAALQVQETRESIRWLAKVLPPLILALSVFMISMNLSLRIVLFGSILAVLGGWYWRLALDGSERARLMSQVSRLVNRSRHSE